MTREQDRLRARKDDRETRPNPPARIDLLALAMTCALPTEARLEAMLDRIEGLK
ncbi:MAG: hypothetical protein RLZZ528_1127 [Pseudomonadota bacterium]|jgi:hypothetical protein